jgi:hypothetical protein
MFHVKHSSYNQILCTSGKGCGKNLSQPFLVVKMPDSSLRNDCSAPKRLRLADPDVSRETFAAHGAAAQLTERGTLEGGSCRATDSGREGRRTCGHSGRRPQLSEEIYRCHSSASGNADSPRTEDRGCGGQDADRPALKKAECRTAQAGRFPD